MCEKYCTHPEIEAVRYQGTSSRWVCTVCGEVLVNLICSHPPETRRDLDVGDGQWCIMCGITLPR